MEKITKVDGQFLFAPEILEKLSRWSEISGELSVKGLYARPLEISDHQQGYLELLSQLTQVGEVSETEFEQRFKQMQATNEIGHHYIIVVLVDKSSDKIIASSTLFLEYKFIHQCATRGRLEDVVVSDSYRGKKVGELIVRIISELAREVYNCYKLTLDCTDELKKFYAKNNFAWASNMLAIRFR